MAGVTVVMSGDEAALFRSYQKIIDQANKLGSANSKTSKESQEAAKKAKEAAQEQAKAEREHLKTMERGKAMMESLRTPQEAYNAAVADANELHAKGAIDAETLARKLQQLKSRLEEQTGVSARNAAVERARLDVMAQNGVVSDKAAAAINRYEADLVELDRKQEAGAMSAQELARAQAKVRGEFDKSVGLADKQNALVTSATGQLAQYATAAGAVALAVRAIAAGWETVVDQQEKGLSALEKTQDTGRALLQISDSPEEFASMRAEAQALATREGVDVATVERVMFSAVSEGFRDALPELIAANQVISPEAAAGVAGQVPALFQGTIGALEAVDLTLKAARDSRLNFEDIARSLPGAAEGGAVAKATPEETLAVLSVLAGRFKSGDTAADRIKAFSAKSGIDAGTEDRESFAGQGIIRVVERLDAMTAEQRADYLKDSQELNTAYIALSEELPTIKARMEDIQRERASFAEGGGILRERMEIAAGDEQLTALKANAIETAKLEEAYRLGKGVEGAAADSATMATERLLLGSGVGAQTANRVGVGSTAARAAVAGGADADTGAAVGFTASQAAGSLGNPFVVLQGLSSAAAAMNRSAAAQEAAAKNAVAKPSVDAARLQAGLAQGGL